MEILMLYRTLCQMSLEQGRAITASELMNNSGTARPTFYRHIKLLINAGYVIKVARGFYSPCDVYQWHIDDVLEQKNATR